MPTPSPAVIEVASAAKRAMDQSTEAERRCAELTELAQRAAEQAASIRDLAASLTQTTSSVAKVAIDVCRYHSYRQAFEATQACVAHRPPPIDIETFLSLVDGSKAAGYASGGAGGTEPATRRGSVVGSGGALVAFNEVDEMIEDHDRLEDVNNDLARPRHHAGSNVRDGSTNTDGVAQLTTGDECLSSFFHSFSVPTIRLPCSASTVTAAPATSVTCLTSASSSPPETNLDRHDVASALDKKQNRKQLRTASNKVLQLQSARAACRSSSYIIEQMSSDSEVEEILLRTPTLQKLRTLERLSTDALDPDTLEMAAAATVSSGQVRQSRPRDRQQRRSFSPLLDSNERDHYSVTRIDESGRNSPKHIFIPVTSESLSGTRLQSSSDNVHTDCGSGHTHQPTGGGSSHCQLTDHQTK